MKKITIDTPMINPKLIAEIEDYPNYYITDKYEIYNKKTNRILKPTKVGQVRLYKSGGSFKAVSVSKIVSLIKNSQ